LAKLHLAVIADALAVADLFVSIGTSGTVHPAAGFVNAARRSGAQTLEINLEPSLGASRFHRAVHGPAGTEVPKFVERILSSIGTEPLRGTG
jgi:NAD-dependent deacetylase